MPRVLYTSLLYVLTPLILLRLLWRSRRAPAYARRWRERFALAPALEFKGKVIWVHAVSVGETLAAVPLIKALQVDYPAALVVVTTTTPTGSEQVRKVFGDSVYHVYAPYDLPDVLTRFFARIRPAILIIMETELWPNLIYKCKKLGVPVAVVNARLSAKSAAGYRKIASLSKPMLRDISLVAAQSPADGERFVDLGLDREKLVVTGNIKFDLQLDEALREQAASLKADWRGPGGRLIWLAASTHGGEDEQILSAFSQVLRVVPDTLLVLVPRHPERFNNVARQCVDSGFTVTRRSQAGGIDQDVQILLGDTMGELLLFCGASDMVFVGGSLVPVGGHNLIEPAAWGVPVLTGPHLFNFAEVASKLTEAGGLKLCKNDTELATAIIDLLQNAGARQRLADAARSVADANRGALLKLSDGLRSLLC